MALEKRPSIFEDITTEAGIDFLHYDGRSGGNYYMETTASGGGWLDYDNDGDLDLYLVNGAPTRGSSEPPEPPVNRLFENRGGEFFDVTELAGVGDTGYGQGMCVGDVDGDGWLDLLVTNFGPDRLYRNAGDGRFEEVSDRAGIAAPLWSLGCAFGDLDGDSDLDLYVTRYVDFSYDNNPRCGDPVRDLWLYCRPDKFNGMVDHLFVNDGSGRFTEEGARRGINQGLDDRGMGVILSDVDSDGNLDIFVANDASPNRLYVNDGNGYFSDQALLVGTAVNLEGRSESTMGVDFGDVDGDGLQDLFVTSFSMESNTLYKNAGNLVFDDSTGIAGMAGVSLRTVSWGTRFLDYDNDGDLDLVTANGAVDDNIELFDPTLDSRQRNSLFENDGTGRFRDISAEVGSSWQQKHLSRGLAVGDHNNDGRLDLLVTNTNDLANLFENRLDTGHHWLGLRLRGRAPNSFAIGARARMTIDGKILTREVRSGGSFASQSDLRLHFGLGDHASPVTVDVTWPDGSNSRETVVEIDRYVTLTQPGSS